MLLGTLSRPHPQSRHDGLAVTEVALLMQNKTGKVFDGKTEGAQDGQFDASNEHITVSPLQQDHSGAKKTTTSLVFTT